MTGTIGKTKKVAPGWYESGARAGFRQWWDGHHWHETYWPRGEGVQPLAYAPQLPRVDISSPYGPVFDIVGEAYREEQIVAALGFRPGLDEERVAMTKAELIPEPDNPHDAYAVAVRIGGHSVGDLSVHNRKGGPAVCRRHCSEGGGAVPEVDEADPGCARGDRRRGAELKKTTGSPSPEPLDVFPEKCAASRSVDDASRAVRLR